MVILFHLPTWLLLHVRSSHANDSFLLVINSHDVKTVVVNSISSYFLDELGTKPAAIKVSSVELLLSSKLA